MVSQALNGRFSVGLLVSEQEIESLPEPQYFSFGAAVRGRSFDWQSAWQDF